MKKQYIKPAMRVHQLNLQTRLLVESDTDYWGRIPGQPADENKLA